MANNRKGFVVNRYIRLKHLAFLTAIAFALPIFSADKYWTGAAGANASTAGSWCDDAELTVVSTAAPADGDDIHLTSGTAAMTWNLNIYVNSWEQDGYTGTVTFKTGKQNGVATKTATINGYTENNGETRILKVTGDIVFNTGTWTTTGQPSLTSGTAVTNGQGVYRLLVEAGGDVTIGTGATVDLKGKGFASQQGPGGASSNDCAAHGGSGSYFATKANTIKCYGVISSPITIGSGGRNSGGGGAIKITAGGDMVVNGTIDVTGANPGSYHSGSGGSINITAASISGTGTLNANGGTGQNAGYDIGGGGGRIAVKVTGAGATVAAFTGTIKAKLGGKTGSSGAGDGSGGTIYLEDAADGAGCGTLIIDNCEGGFASDKTSYDQTTILSSSIFDVTPKKIIFRPEAKAKLDIGRTYDLPEIVQESNSSLTVMGGLEIGATTTARLVHGMPDVPLLFRSSGATISVGANGDETLVVGSGQKLYVDAGAQVNGSVRIASGGTLSHLSGASTRMNLNIAGDFTLDSGGTVTASGRGNESKGSKTSNCGGAYGGRSLSGGASCYGSIRRPTHYGSTGVGTGKSNGGGAIRITATGAMTINGTVACNGANATYRTGSGGSIWLTGASISGTGTISANGGNQSDRNISPGGGGRIAIWLTGSGADFSNFNINNITAYGGKYSDGTCKGGAGTIYLKTGDQAANEGTLIVKNLTTDTYTDIMVGGSSQAADVTDYDVGEVIVNKAKLYLYGATMNLVRGWKTMANATFTCAASGGVVVNGLADAYFYGNNTFASFVCEVPGKTLYFGTGTTNSLTIASGGTFTLTGDESTKLNLRPAVAGEEWKLKVPVTGLTSYNVRYVAAEYSNASTGEEIVATDSAESSEGTCTNWRFLQAEVGQENTWLGTTDSNWQETTNWSLERAPLSTDNVIIPATANDPVLPTDVELLGLSIASGAKLVLSGDNLAVTGSLNVQGQIVASGKERIDVSATNIVMAAGSLVPARSTFVISGDSDQTISLNAQFWKLQFAKTGGNVAWSGSASVGDALSMSGQASVAFASGAALSANSFVADGTVGSAAGLVISGALSLDAAKFARAKGVSLAGVDARAGSTLYVTAPFFEGEGNYNCDFGTGLFVWTGEGNDSVFANGDNWAGGVAPGANDVAEISSAATITISSDTEVGGLFLGGGASAVSFTARGSLAIGGPLYVGTNATLTLDVPATVGGYCMVDDGGTITHTSIGASGTYKVDLTVAGDMYISALGKINVSGRGFSNANGTATPGNVSVGASHGGCGSPLNGYSDIRRCYGSFVAPTTYGSGGKSGNGSNGGGVVKLVVAGELYHEGTITADGTTSGNYYSASGGSVWIKCGNLAGKGGIYARGGNGNTDTYSNLLGGGGRVAIERTTAGDFSGYTGSATAYGGYYYRSTGTTSAPGGSAGSVTWIVPGAAPRIVLDDNGTDVSGIYGADLPVAVSRGGDSAKVLKTCDFVVKNSGKINLIADATVNDVSLESGGRILLHGNTLYIRSHRHKNRRGWAGSVDESAGGQIVWLPSGLAITVK